MFASFRRPNKLSQKVMRVIFSIYLAVTCLITAAQFLTEYLKTQDSIVNELLDLEVSIRGPIAISLWQYNQHQLEALVDGIIAMPMIVGVDILDQEGNMLTSARSYASSSAPLSLFDTQSDLTWMLNDKAISLGSLKLYSSSEVVLDRVLFGFSLIAITAIIKISLLFSLFVWAFERHLAMPLKELMSQVHDIKLDQHVNKRIKLSNHEDNELQQLQKQINSMLTAIEKDRISLLNAELAKRHGLEEAVTKRTAQLQTLNEELKDLAKKDSLTGILNHGSFFEAAQHLLALCGRQKTSVCFILMDLDNFKRINDSYGHFFGDKVLTHFAHTIHSFLRESDLFGRLGGEEFAVFLPNTKIEDAFKLAEKLRSAIYSSTLTVESDTIRYTVSIGISACDNQAYSVEELFKQADAKLYTAKEKGRDHVEK